MKLENKYELLCYRYHYETNLSMTDEINTYYSCFGWYVYFHYNQNQLSIRFSRHNFQLQKKPFKLSFCFQNRRKINKIYLQINFVCSLATYLVVRQHFWPLIILSTSDLTLANGFFLRFARLLIRYTLRINMNNTTSIIET